MEVPHLPGAFGVCTTFSADTPDVERFAQVRSLKSLICEGKCLRLGAKPAHFVGHVPAMSNKRSSLLKKSTDEFLRMRNIMFCFQIAANRSDMMEIFDAFLLLKALQ